VNLRPAGEFHADIGIVVADLNLHVGAHQVVTDQIELLKAIG